MREPQQGEVGPGARGLGRRIPGQDLDGQVREGVAQGGKAGGQPAGQQRRAEAEPEDAGPRRVSDAAAQARERTQQRSELTGEIRARLGRAQAGVEPFEQGNAEELLQRPDPVADGALRQAEFVAGQRHAAVPQHGFQGEQSREGRHSG